MNKLIKITLRWMRRDKKRTLLSFLSIVMAMYMLTFLGVYFSAGVSLIRSNNAYADGNWHVSFECDNMDQAMLITKNVSVENGGFAIQTQAHPFISGHINDYWLSDRSDKNYIPRITINGSNTFEQKGIYTYFELYGYAYGDIDTLYRENGKPTLEGRMPSKSGEVLLTKNSADRYGLSVGDTMTLGYTAQKVKAEYAEFKLTAAEAEEWITEQSEEGSSTFNRKSKLLDNLREGLDENGAPIKFTEDKSGELLGRLFGYIAEDNSGYTISGEILTMITKSTAERSYYIMETTDPESGDTVFRTVKLTMLPETDKSQELKFTVTGISSDSLGRENYAGVYFSPNDDTVKQYLPCAPESTLNCFVRIKGGLDIDTETRQIRESANIRPDNPVTNFEPVKQNDSLIYLEGRGYERNQGIALIFCLIIIVVAVFVFFARLIINNAFELSSSYRLTQYGALKTVGTSDRQIFAMIMIECMIYMLTALPIAVMLALFTGRLVLDKIADLKIFDLIYGDGVTEKFIKLDIIPMLFIAAIGVAVFSVVMSAYACAIRIRKLSPIEAATSGRRSKKIKAKKQGWLSRRLFGFSVGYAVRSIRKNRMRFGITLLAAVVSGTLVVTLTTLTKTVDMNVELFSTYESESDFDLYTTIPLTESRSVPFEVAYLEKSGLFSSVEPFMHTHSLIKKELIGGDLPDKLSDLYKGKGISLKIISRDTFRKLSADMTYDELLASKSVLVCRTCANRHYGKDRAYTEEQFIESFFGSDKPPYEIEFRATTDAEGWIHLVSDSIPVYDSVPESLTIDLIGKRSGKSVQKLDLPVAGICSTDTEELCNLDDYAPVVFLPVETLGTFMDEGDAEMIQNILFYDALDISLCAAEGKEFEAKELLADRYGSDNFSDHIVEKITNEKASDAMKIAGYSLAFIIMALALINMLSTSAAAVVNRSNEISMLRACGMSLRQVTGSLAAEAVLTSLLNAGFSAGLGYVLSAFLLEFFGVYELRFSFLTPIAVFLLTIAVTLLPYLFTLRKLAKVPVTENIKRKE